MVGARVYVSLCMSLCVSVRVFVCASACVSVCMCVCARVRVSAAPATARGCEFVRSEGAAFVVVPVTPPGGLLV